MNLVNLYMAASTGEKGAEKQLFSYLTVRFRAIAYLKIGNRHDAEEIVQDALMVIAKEYKKQEFEKSFISWAYRIFDNRILGFIGRKKRRADLDKRAQNDGTLGPPAMNPDPNFEIQLSDCLEKVKATNDRYAKILALHYEGYDTEEICQELKLSPGNLYMILSRARAMLKRCLDTGDISK